MNDFSEILHFWPETDAAPDLNKLLQHLNSSSPEMANLMNQKIIKAWQENKFHIKNTSVPNVTTFAQRPAVRYEYMTARIAPGAVEDGIGVLHITFPAGASEAEKVHIHPGGRVLHVLSGKGKFHYFENSKEFTVMIEPGDIIMMPPRTAHNFAAGKEADMIVISAHIGYKDIESDDAITWID